MAWLLTLRSVPVLSLGFFELLSQLMVLGSLLLSVRLPPMLRWLLLQ